MRNFLTLLGLFLFLTACQKPSENTNPELKATLQGTWWRAGGSDEFKLFQSKIIFEDDIMVWRDSLVIDRYTYDQIKVVEGYCKVDYKVNDGNLGNTFGNPQFKDIKDILVVYWNKNISGTVTEYKNDGGTITKIKDKETQPVQPPLLSAFVTMKTRYIANFKIVASDGIMLYEMTYGNRAALEQN